MFSVAGILNKKQYQTFKLLVNCFATYFVLVFVIVVHESDIIRLIVNEACLPLRIISSVYHRWTHICHMTLGCSIIMVIKVVEPY